MIDKLIGKILKERYQIQSLLGRQTGRRTFLAKDLQTQSPVVVKLLLFNPDFTWDDLKLFQREAETLRNIDHPAIPQYLDYFEVETAIGKGSALVQSYIEAKSLQDWVESGRSFSEVELKAIAIQLLEVIQYLHSYLPPVIHRDIKPSNILLTDRSGNSLGTIYLVDFGSVQTVVQSGTITVVGTYGYMPPEQFGGKTTPASDLYSLGATLIYLITRNHPADLPTRRGRIQFEVNSYISPRFQAWIKCLIQPDIEQRFNTAKKALEVLQNDHFALDGLSTTLSKPRGSEVSLKKTDEELQITIPLVLKEIWIYIGQKNATYIVNLWGIFISKKVLLTKNIVKLERFTDGLNIYFKRDYFSIKTLNPIEAEWLFYELSNWLDLHIQQGDVLTQKNNELIITNLPEASQGDPVDFSSLSTIKAPSTAQCYIRKTDKFIKVSAPAKVDSTLLGCLIKLSIFIVFILVWGAVGFTAAFVFGSIFAPIFAPILANLNLIQSRQDDRIILRIDQNTACLYKSYNPEKYLNLTYTKHLQKIVVVYCSPRPYNSTHYHIELKTGLRDQLLVGNRQYWLSEHEAYWIAYELSQWLKIPVTEREVVDTSY
jgi:serine/threonine protein kinase